MCFLLRKITNSSSIWWCFLTISLCFVYRLPKKENNCFCMSSYFIFGILLIMFNYSLKDQLYVLREMFFHVSLPCCSQSLFGDISVVTWVVELAGPNHCHSHTKRRRKVHSKNFSRKRHKPPLLSGSLHVYSLFLDLVSSLIQGLV